MIEVHFTPLKCLYGGRTSRSVLRPECSYLYFLVFWDQLMYFGAFEN